MDVPNGEPVRAEVIRPPVSNLYDVPRQRKRFRRVTPSPVCSRGRAGRGPAESPVGLRAGSRRFAFAAITPVPPPSSIASPP